jgi:hypothetical protein
VCFLHFKLNKFLHLSDVCSIYYDVPTVFPNHFSVELFHSIVLVHPNKFVVVDLFEKVQQAWRWMFSGDLVNGIAISRCHVHGNQKSHESLLTTVPSIRFFHLEWRPAGIGVLDFFAPIWRCLMRLTLAI